MKEDEVNKFEKVQGQLEGLYNEIGILSRKSPNDAINMFKLKFINQILEEANTLLVDDYVPFDGFQKFDENEIPTNSDATMIFEQYLNCLEKLRGDNITTREYKSGWFWIIDGNPSDLRTKSPLKLKEK